MRGQFRRIGHDADCLLLPADDECQPDIAYFGDFGLQAVGQFIERLIAPVTGRTGFGRQRQHHDWHVVDSAHSDLRRRDAHGDTVDIGLYLLVDPHCGIFRVRPDEEAGSDHHAVIFGLRVNVLYTVNRFDDGFQRLAHQLDSIARR